jgi:hypothetical protein
MADAIRTIAVYGAAGHTGNFVINELKRRGMPFVAVARDVTRISKDVTAFAARIDDPAALDRAFAGCAVIINCAGPFLDTASPIVEAALRANASYIDLTAEQPAALALFDNYDDQARAAGVSIIPAAGFYGALADLLASALVGSGHADELTTAIALDHWWPTEGTRITGARNTSPRMMIEHGKLVPIALPARQIDWEFAGTFGIQRMVELSFSEVINISRHISVDSLHSFLNTASLEEIRDVATPPPAAIDADGRSAQRFVLDVVAKTADGTRRAQVSGQDIYAVSAPIAVEAAARLLDPAYDRSGALALGQAFDPRSFLDAIASAHLTVRFNKA